MIKNNIIDLIGNTPLIKLKYPSELTGCEIYGKAEFLNPGGSIKDRTALGIIKDAEEAVNFALEAKYPATNEVDKHVYAPNI